MKTALAIVSTVAIALAVVSTILVLQRLESNEIGHFETEEFAQFLAIHRDNIERFEPVSSARINRGYPEPLSPILPSRFTYVDGIYRNLDEMETRPATLMFVGDLMLSGGFADGADSIPRRIIGAYERHGAYCFSESFYHVRPIFESADFVAGNLEMTLSHTSPYLHEVFRLNHNHLNSPITYLDALRYAGFDMVFTGNNHSIDAEFQGVIETQYHLNRYNIIHTGTFLDENCRRFVIVDINGINVGFLNYVRNYNARDERFTLEGRETVLNMYIEPRHIEEGRETMLGRSKAIRDIADAREAGAEFIVVYMHWGTSDYDSSITPLQQRATDEQVRWAHELANAGADFIFGSHPHYVQEYSYVVADDGRVIPVAYSLGNFAAGQHRYRNRQSMILSITIERTSDGIVIADEGYIPVFEHEYFDGLYFPAIPVTPEFNEFINFSDADRHKEIIRQRLFGGVQELRVIDDFLSD